MRYQLLKLAACCFAMHASPVLAKDAVQISLVETVDVVSVSGGSGDDVFLLDNLDVVADLDLDALLGWRGGQAHVHVLNNLGSVPNDRAATLQGVNNIEVASQRLRLFEAWVEQRLSARTSVRIGLYDLNSEFYANDAAGLLIAPAFGVGSEIAATGRMAPRSSRRPPLRCGSITSSTTRAAMRASPCSTPPPGRWATRRASI